MGFPRHRQELNRWVSRLLSGPDHPQQPFVHDQTSFAEVYAMAGCLQDVFQKAVNAPFVCLCTQDKTVIAAALLASLAGGPALILPHAESLSVLSELHTLTGFTHVVTDRSLQVPDAVACVVPEKGVAGMPLLDASRPSDPDREWVRLFTGGSTGSPKMWTKTVRNLLAETISIITHYDVTGKDRLLATVSPNHIYGLLYTILMPLLASASVAGATPAFPKEIMQVLRDVDASILISVPAHYRALNGHVVRAPRLRLAFSSAGMLAAEDAAAFSRQTGVGIAEIYGSTETGGIASRIRAKGETDFKPYEGIDLVVDGDGLKVRSDYLSPGLQRDARGYFKTGDRAESTPGGRFLLLGRDDGVVKVGGRRVDLEAVQEMVKNQSGVRDALVISLPVGRSRENQVVAVVEGEVDPVELNRSLVACLEPYARPKRIKVVAEMPITAAGKYDRAGIETLFRDTPPAQGH